MCCDTVRQILLDQDWDAGGRQRAMDALTHLQACAACQVAMADFDRLRTLLGEGDAPDKAAHAVGPLPLRHKSRWRISFFSATGAVAAALVIAMVGFAIGRQIYMDSEPSRLVADSAGQPMTSAEIEQRLRAFEEIRELFDARATWVLLSNEGSDLGLSSGPVTEEPHVVVLRLRMLRAGDEISLAELIMVAGESAHLSLPLPDGQVLSYQVATSVQDPSRLVLSAQMQSALRGEQVGALATELRLRNDRSMLAGMLGTPTGTLELHVDFAESDLRRG
jgi:hypothetical protein